MSMHRSDDSSQVKITQRDKTVLAWSQSQQRVRPHFQKDLCLGMDTAEACRSGSQVGQRTGHHGTFAEPPQSSRPEV